LKKSVFKKNGKRVNIPLRVASDIKNMMLAQAYMEAKSAGMQLRIHCIDGIIRVGYANTDDNPLRVIVDVSQGFIKNAWVG
jgi:hypothetical protein